MSTFFAAMLVGSAALSVPAWLLGRGRGEAVWWLPFIGAPAILAWLVLAALGVGPQSLSNVIEVVALAVLSVVACYTQVFLLNTKFPDFRRTSAYLVLGLVTTAVLLRLFMPLLPE